MLIYLLKHDLINALTDVAINYMNLMLALEHGWFFVYIEK